MRKTNFIGIRVDPSITGKLNGVASRYNTRKSTIVRDLLAHCDIVYPILRDAMPEQDTALLEKRVYESVRGSIPDNVDPVMVEMVGQMVNRIMTEVAQQIILGKED